MTKRNLHQAMAAGVRPDPEQTENTREALIKFSNEAMDFNVDAEEVAALAWTVKDAISKVADCDIILTEEMAGRYQTAFEIAGTLVNMAGVEAEDLGRFYYGGGLTTEDRLWLVWREHEAENNERKAREALSKGFARGFKPDNTENEGAQEMEKPNTSHDAEILADRALKADIKGLLTNLYRKAKQGHERFAVSGDFHRAAGQMLADLGAGFWNDEGDFVFYKDGNSPEPAGECFSENIGWCPRCLRPLNCEHHPACLDSRLSDEQVQTIKRWEFEQRTRALSEAKSKIKDRCLKHYLEKEPMLFIQADAFIDAPEDDLLTPDADGNAVTGSGTWELMTGAPEVRLLMRADINKTEALRGLKSLYDAISGGFMDDYFGQDINEKFFKEAEDLADFEISF